MLSDDDLLTLALSTRPTLEPEADAAVFLNALQETTGLRGALWCWDDATRDLLAAAPDWPDAPPPPAPLALGSWQIEPAPVGPGWPPSRGGGAIVDLDGRYRLAAVAPDGLSLDEDTLTRLRPVFQRLADTVEVGRRHRRLRDGGKQPQAVRTRLLSHLAELADTAPADRIRQALSIASDVLDLSTAIVSRIDPAADTYTVVACHAPGAPLEPGQVFPLGQTYCSITLDAPDVLAIDAMRTSPYAGHPCYRAFGLESYIGVALAFADGTRGTLNVSDAESRDRPFTETDREVLRVLGAWVVATLDRVHAAEALRESQVQLRTVIDQLPVVLFALDREGRVTLSEGRGLAALGLTGGEIVGASVFDLYDDASLGGIREALDGEPTTWQSETDGTVWETHATPRVNEAGESAGILAVTFDVTERVEAARAVAETSARLALVLGATPDAIVFADLDHRVEYVNPAFADVFGVAPKAAIGRPSRSFFADPADASPLDRPRGAKPTTDRYRRGDGTFIGETVRAPILGADGALLGHLAVVRDVTSREEMQAAIEEERARYEQLIEHADDLIYQLDREGTLTLVNPSATRTLGYEAADLLGRSFAGLVHPDHREEVVAFYQRQATARAASTHLEVPVVARDGTTVWLQQNVVRSESESGTVEFHIVARDVTERRRVEAQLREARANAEAAIRSKEIFLANVSHEMRTPLHAVLGLSRLLAAGPVSASQTDLVTGISRAADTLLALINDLLDRARLDSGQSRFHQAPFFLQDVLDDVRHLLVPVAAEKGVAVEVTGPDGIDTLLGDGKRLRQVLLNLGGNAVKFTDEGWVQIAAAVDERGPDALTLRLTVEDTGIGIPADQQARIFEAFVQADDHADRAHGGTGLGLSIVRDLVERQGGTVDVESVEGEGSRFSLRMPFRLAPLDEGVPAPTPVPDATDLSGLHALLVEDNPINRLIACRQAEAWGMTVTEAASGQEGLDALASGTPFDLVLMDIQMPGMDGIEATRRLRAAGHTDVAVIALTASALASRRGALLEAGFDDFALKPFEPTALRRRLGLLVGRASPVPADTAVIDQARLRESAIGDPDIERQLVTMFVDEVRRQTPRLLAAVTGEDWDGLRATAHLLKGQAAYLGATAAVEALAEAEQIGHSGGLVADAVETAAEAASALADAVWALRILYPPLLA